MEKNTTRKVNGFGYRYGNELHVSFDPVIGGWPLELEVSDAVELVPVTKHEARLEGKKTSVGELVALGLVVAGDQHAAEQAFKLSRKEASAQKAAERAKVAAAKAVERAKLAQQKADEALKAAMARAAQ